MNVRKLVSTGVRSAIAAALLLAVVLPGSAYASSSHPVSISGHMYIVDYDWPDPNDTGTRAIGPIGMTNPGGFSTSGCVDEVKGELGITFVGAIGDWLKAKIDARLYEGASCSTSDFDGHEVRYVWLPPDATTTIKFRVDNTDEGDDYIDFTIKIHNSHESA